MNRLMTEFKDQMLCIMADGGTKDQSHVKMEILLGKRSKTDAMLTIERELRDFFREYYKVQGDEIINIAPNNDLLRKLAVTTGLLKAHQKLDEGQESPERKQMREIANNYCISINLLDDEEYNRALKIYRERNGPQ